MKEIYRNPFLYYILAPIVVALWPLLVWAVHLPGAKENLKVELKQIKDAQQIIQKILILDADRLEFADPKETAAEFDYAIAVERIASLCGISATNYNISSKPVRAASGQKTQDAQVVLNEVDIAKFAKFLSTLQLRWSSLKCEKLTLTKMKGLPDAWKVDLNFKYYY